MSLWIVPVLATFTGRVGRTRAKAQAHQSRPNLGVGRRHARSGLVPPYNMLSYVHRGLHVTLPLSRSTIQP